MSYKIFRNATFLRIISENKENKLLWENLLSDFMKISKPPFIIGYETKTISIIFSVFSISFIIMFFEMNKFLSFSLGMILLITSLSIYMIPLNSKKYLKYWKEVLSKHQH